MTDPHVHELPHGDAEPGPENYLSGREIRIHIADAVANHLEGLARRIRDGEVTALTLGWDGSRDFRGTLHRESDGRDVDFDMVVGEATVVPL